MTLLNKKFVNLLIQLFKMDEYITIKTSESWQNHLVKRKIFDRENQKCFKKQKLFSELKNLKMQEKSNRDEFWKSLLIILKENNIFKIELNFSKLPSYKAPQVLHYLDNVKKLLKNPSNISCCESVTLESIEMLLEKDLEESKLRKKYIFNKHSDILPEYRIIILDWILEICSMYKFQRETYYLTMAYFDIYVSNCPTNTIRKEQLQLIALSSLMMATKVEEFKCLPMEDVRFLCDEIFTAEQILHAEKSIIQVLEWKCYRSTPNLWLLRFIHILNKTINENEFSLCTRLLDIATFDLNYLKFPNSIFAAACIKLVISIDIFPVYSHPKFSLNVKNCVFWLNKYLDICIYTSYKRIRNEKFINCKNGNEICLRFPHLSLIQSYDSNIDFLNKEIDVNFIHSDNI